MTSVELVRPAERYRESFLRALHEFQSEGLSWWRGVALDLAERDFSAFVSMRLAEAHAGLDGGPRKTHLWAVVGDRFVGRIAIFHELTEALRVEGGHVGYDTVPSCRRGGIATEMLRLALPWAREIGLEEVLVTCDASNAPSIRVIEKNGGLLRETRVIAPGKVKRYYAIALR